MYTCTGVGDVPADQTTIATFSNVKENLLQQVHEYKHGYKTNSTITLTVCAGLHARANI